MKDLNNISTTFFLISALVGIACYLIFRQVNLWYWKINNIVDLLSEQNELLREYIAGNKSQENNDEWICPNCKNVNSNKTFECTKCKYKVA